MTNPTNPFNWQMPTASDLVTDLPADFEVFGQAVATSMADLLGGTTGQVLSKTSNTDMDFTWVTSDDANAIQNSIVDAKGDLIAATANDTPARLAVGTNGHVLTADSTAATGIKWAAPAGGGKVLQVVNATYGVAVSNSTSTYADTGLTATITPSSASSKILVLFQQNGLNKSAANVSSRVNIRLLRGATSILSLGDYFLYNGTAVEIVGETASASYLDSPATTSATTYKTQFMNPVNVASVAVQAVSVHTSTITLLEIGA
jgi:hypothetical protein